MGIEQGNVTHYHCRWKNKEWPSLLLWLRYSSDPGVQNHSFEVILCAQDTHLYLPCSTEERNKLLSCQLWAMLPDQCCLVYSGREITSLEMTFSWLAGPQLTEVPLEHLWSLQLIGVHVAISRDPEQEAKPAECKSLRGSKACYFRVVFFFSWRFLWPPILNCSLPSTLSSPPPRLIFFHGTFHQPCHIFSLLVWFLASLPMRPWVPGEHNVLSFGSLL